jgi:hypothetical protein
MEKDNKKKRLNRSNLSTIIGVATAIAAAWLTIDWTNFDIKKEWPKLVLSAVIAAGGVFTKIKGGTDEEV